MRAANIIAILALFGFALTAQAQTENKPITLNGKSLDEASGRDLYLATCSACHGADGSGNPQSVVGFEVELPDFNECSFATPETSADWTAIVYNGGPVRAFDQKMPAFGDLLTLPQIEKVVDYVRSLCGDNAWPRGELNLPRPLVTEKAFPENEAVVTVSSESGAVSSEFVYEHRIGARNQYEIVVPYDLVRRENRDGWNRGLGDIELAFKRVMLHSSRTGSILSLGIEMGVPTGKQTEGLGGGKSLFAPFASFGQILPRDGFVQVQAKFERPITHEPATSEAFLRTAVGKTFAQNGGFGRAWSPIVEFVSGRDLVAGEKTKWDIVPQMQVSLSTRQHILLNAGLRMPLNERDGRNKTFMVYFLWDWFDGGLFSGW